MMEPEYVTWMDGEHQMRHVSARYRHALLIDYGERYNLRTFVETGTCAGDTVEAMHGHFDPIYSIELSLHYFRHAFERFGAFPEVHLFHADSAVILSHVIGLLQSPALFWLDAHAAGEQTAQTQPLLAELKAILESGVKGIVLVDDMTAGVLDAPTSLIASYGKHDQEWKDQILRVNLL